MKDAYSLDRDEAGLERSYDLHREAYERIFKRCGIAYFIVGASSGLMGGTGSQEFMVESQAGEDSVVRCVKCGYAANLEVAASNPDQVSQGKSRILTEVATPEKRTVEEVSEFLNVPRSRMIKTLIYMSPYGLIIALVSGEDELSESKLTAIVGGAVRPAHPEEVIDQIGAEIGFLGPQGNHGLPIYADLRLHDAKGMVTGANRNGYHVTGLEFIRDFQPNEYVDLREVKAGEKCSVCGDKLCVVRAIELGHIFKLGTKYSSSMLAEYLSEDGKERPIVMGSYGIGIERILAAAIEGNADEHGIRWNSALSPLDAVIVPLGGDEAVLTQAEDIYKNLKATDLDILIDDREVSPGVKMKDADLIGIPSHVIVSSRNLAKDQIEVKNRWSGERFYVKSGEIEKSIRNILKACLPAL